MAAVVIASLAEGRAALEAARSSGVAAELESPPDAASIYGVLWFAELNRALRAEFPGVPFSLTLDCGHRADLAHAALAEGIKRIRFSGHPDAARALQDVAAQLNAELIAAPNIAAPNEVLYVVADPDISSADRAWIQSIRAQHDPQHDLIGPHFTLVFGIDDQPVGRLLAHVQAIASQTSPFEFEARTVQVFPGAATERYLFLLPEKGAAELRVLYRALRLEPVDDIAFVPHITIGRCANAATATTLAKTLNAAARTIHGRISTLRLIAVADQDVRECATVGLTGS
jgi:2'-5' RNA ligase